MRRAKLDSGGDSQPLINSAAMPRRDRSLRPLALKMFPFNSEMNIQLKIYYTSCVFQNILGTA